LEFFVVWNLFEIWCLYFGILHIRGNAPPRSKTGRNAVKACYKKRKRQALKERPVNTRLKCRNYTKGLLQQVVMYNIVSEDADSRGTQYHHPSHSRRDRRAAA